MPNTPNSNPFTLTPKESTFNLFDVTSEVLDDLQNAQPLLGLSRCLQLTVMLNLTLKGVDVQLVSHLNQACIEHWKETHEL